MSHAVHPMDVRLIWSMFHALSENCWAIMSGWYMPEATRLAPKTAPVMMVSIFVSVVSP